MDGPAGGKNSDATRMADDPAPPVARGGRNRAEVDTAANIAINTEESIVAPKCGKECSNERVAEDRKKEISRAQLGIEHEAMRMRGVDWWIAQIRTSSRGNKRKKTRTGEPAMRCSLI